MQPVYRKPVEKETMLALVKASTRIRSLEVRRLKIMAFVMQVGQQYQTPIYIGTSVEKIGVLTALEDLLNRVCLKLVKIDAIKQNIMSVIEKLTDDPVALQAIALYSGMPVYKTESQEKTNA